MLVSCLVAAKAQSQARVFLGNGHCFADPGKHSEVLFPCVCGSSQLLFQCNGKACTGEAKDCGEKILVAPKELASPHPSGSGLPAVLCPPGCRHQVCTTVLPEGTEGFVRSHLVDSEQRLCSKGSHIILCTGAQGTPRSTFPPVVLVCEHLSSFP